MLKHAFAEYALWCDSVAAQIPSFCAMQRWQIPVHGDSWCAQHIWPCMWHWNCNISLLGGNAQFLNFRQKKNYNFRERGMIVLAASEWIRQRTVWTPQLEDRVLNDTDKFPGTITQGFAAAEHHCPFSCLMGPLGETPISLPPAASIRLTPTQLFWKCRQISWMIHWSWWPSFWVLKIHWL